MITLDNIFSIKGQSRVRRGRGTGSGVGKTCGRGVKGQKSRSGSSKKYHHGQMPLYKALPKIGFSSRRKKAVIVTLNAINRLIISEKLDKFDVIDKDKLYSVGLIKSVNDTVKLLCKFSSESFSENISVNVDLYSATARKVINDHGGKIIEG